MALRSLEFWCNYPILGRAAGLFKLGNCYNSSRYDGTGIYLYIEYPAQDQLVCMVSRGKSSQCFLWPGILGTMVRGTTFFDPVCLLSPRLCAD